MYHLYNFTFDLIKRVFTQQSIKCSVYKGMIKTKLRGTNDPNSSAILCKLRSQRAGVV